MKFRTPNKKVVFRSEKYDQNNVKISKIELNIIFIFIFLDLVVSMFYWNFN